MIDPDIHIPADIRAGLDGHLFLVGGSNDVLEQYADTPVLQWLLWQWRHLIHTRESRLRAMNIVYKHITIPEKVTIHDNLLKDNAIDWRRSPAFRLYNQDPYYKRFPLRRARLDRYIRRQRRWRITLIDLVGPLRRQRNHQQLYFRTDTHWTFEGRLIGYREICRAFGAQAVCDFPERRTEFHPDWLGDLGAACRPKITQGATLYLVQRDAVRIYASPIVECRERLGQAHTLHTGAHVIYRNERSPDPRCLILFGDSYAHFAPIMLTAMLAETFRELHFIWSTQLDYQYIEHVQPDLVLTEMAERFLLRPPDDGWNLERYAAERFADEFGASKSLVESSFA